MTYEELKKANDAIVPLEIQKKDYAPVNQRIKAFRMVYPEGFITTEMVSNADGVCVFRARVGYEDERGHHVLGTGTSYEKETSSFINKTSFIENCETSAVGRALGMAGFGIDMSVASAEEVQTAMLNQGDKPAEKPVEKPVKKPAAKATEEQVRLIRELFDEGQQAKILSYYKIDKLEDVTMTAASKMIEKARAKKEGQA